jgi:hypothetical protein
MKMEPGRNSKTSVIQPALIWHHHSEAETTVFVIKLFPYAFSLSQVPSFNHSVFKDLSWLFLLSVMALLLI